MSGQFKDQGFDSKLGRYGLIPDGSIDPLGRSMGALKGCLREQAGGPESDEGSLKLGVPRHH